MNSVNDSGEFQEVESNCSGRLSYASSQLAMIPSPCSLLSRDKRLHLDTWNTSGLWKTFLVINFLRLIHPEIILKELTLAHTKRERGPVPQATGADDKQNRDTIPMPTFA